MNDLDNNNDDCMMHIEDEEEESKEFSTGPCSMSVPFNDMLLLHLSVLPLDTIRDWCETSPSRSLFLVGIF